MNSKVAVITGGSSGIGRTLVLKYAQEGYAVVFTGRNEERMKSVENDLEKIKADFLGLRLAAEVLEDNKSLIDQTVEKYGRLDVLICNAGISMRALFNELDLDVFEKVMQINFNGEPIVIVAGKENLIFIGYLVVRTTPVLGNLNKFSEE